MLWLGRTIALGNHNYPWFQRDKNFDSLRADPDYQRLMNEIKSHWEEYQRAFSET